jgi:DNA polymerase
MWWVELAHAADLAGFRTAGRAALALGIEPDAIDWRVAGAPGLPLGSPLPMPADPPAPRVPRRFVELAELAICHADQARFALLHRLLARLQASPRLLEDRSDPQVDRLEEMAKAVSRDRHKMRAFLRFREVQDEDGPHFIAWFEPDHHILRLDAGFFIRRFASQRWTILTPHVSVHWDGAALHWLPGAEKADAPAEDPVEAVWKTYYAHIFNPARLKVKAMQAEMPKKYWRNLPEAELIPELVAQAEARTKGMIERGDREAKGAGKLFGAAGAGPPPAPSPSPGGKGDLAALAAQARGCTRCPLHTPATQTVFGEGPSDARLMIVGEQPGDQEDLAGRPFVGPAGQLLDQCLAEAGIDRARAYVTNAVKHFKFELRGKRRIHASPNAGEIEACRWWLDAERAALKPGLVLMLGASAARAVLGRPVTVGKERGRRLPLPDGGAGFLTVHPSYLLRIENAAVQRAERARFVDELKAAAALAAEA